MSKGLIVKECIGIDISKSTFVCVLAQKSCSGDIYFSRSTSFSNTKTGFNQLLKWYGKYTTTDKVLFLMEATGVYYESLAYHLYKLKIPVVVILPNKAKYCTKSLNVKTKTEGVYSKVLSQFVLERTHDLWEPPLPILKTLREYTRLLSSLKRQKQVIENQREAYSNAEQTSKFIMKTNQSMIRYFAKQIKACEEEIRELINDNEWLNNKVEKIMTIKGVGLLTVATIIGETQGFTMIKNRKQLTGYAGYDVVQNQSGTSLNGRTRISKKGNSNIRSALHMPSFVYIKYNENVKNCYERINEQKLSKMIGLIAMQRKLLTLIYTLWKTDSVYVEDFEKKNNNKIVVI